MYYSIEVIPDEKTGYKSPEKDCYLHSITIDPDSDSVIKYTLTNNYLLSWIQLNAVQYDCLIRWLESCGNFKIFYEYHGCMNPDSEPLERVYGMIARFARVTSAEVKPSGYIVEIRGEGIREIEVLSSN